MTQAALLELAERVEAATGPDFDLSQAIFDMMVAAGFVPDRSHLPYPGYHFTASIDAAMMLVPEGWRAGFEQNASCDEPDKSYAWVWPFVSNYDPDWQLGQEGQQSNPDAQKGYAATPALALCAAALKARAAQSDDR